MQIHQLKSVYRRRKKKLVGRGGRRGTYSGRGIKGQKARAGHRIRPALRDVVKKLPKRRGYRFKSFHLNSQVVNLGLLEKLFPAGSVVTPRALSEGGAIRGRKRLAVKILAAGRLSKPLVVNGCVVSVSARSKIEQAGGKVM